LRSTTALPTRSSDSLSAETMGMPDLYKSARFCAKRDTASISCNSPKIGKFNLSRSRPNRNPLDTRQAILTKAKTENPANGQIHQVALAKSLAPKTIRVKSGSATCATSSEATNLGITKLNSNKTNAHTTLNTIIG